MYRDACTDCTHAPPRGHGGGAPQEGAAGGRRASRERADAAEAEAVELPEPTEVKISTDKKMEREMQVLIRNLDKGQPWVVRATALRRLQGLVLAGVPTLPAFLKAIRSSDFARATRELLADLRSTLVKETLDTLLRLAKAALPAPSWKEYEHFVTDCVLPEALRAVCKANVAIAAHAEAFLSELVKSAPSMQVMMECVCVLHGMLSLAFSPLF